MQVVSSSGTLILRCPHGREELPTQMVARQRFEMVEILDFLYLTERVVH